MMLKLVTNEMGILMDEQLGTVVTFLFFEGEHSWYGKTT